MGAGLQQVMGAEWGPQVWKRITTTSPNKVFKDVAQNSAKRVEEDRKRKATEKAKESRRRSKYARIDDNTAARRSYSRHDGGITPEEVTDDIPVQHLEALKDSYYLTKVVVTEDETRLIERATRQQSENEQWIVERRKRMTASQVGSIVKMRKTTKRSNKVKALLYSNFRGNEATRYGLAKEEESKQRYMICQQQNGHSNLTIYNCGLFVSSINPWLAASPDGCLLDSSNPSQIVGLVEIKNPFSIEGQKHS